MRSIRRVLALAALALLMAAPAARAGTMALKFPRFPVPPHSDREVCYFVRLSRHKAFDSGGFEIVNLGVGPQFVSHHFLMYFYSGNDMGAFPQRKIVDSKACLDFGPADRNQRVLIGGSQSPRSLQRLPPGLAQQIQPGAGGQPIGFILNTHWINESDSVHTAAVKIRIFPARHTGLKRYMLPIFEATANGFLRVPPGKEAKTGSSWAPGKHSLASGIAGGIDNPTGPACVAMLTSHMHKRGKRFLVQLVHRDGSIDSQPLVDTDSYTDPPQVPFDGKGNHRKPLLVSPGESIKYTCTHANGSDGVTQKMGCEEKPNETPGKSIAEVIFATGPFTGIPKDCMTAANCCPAGGPCTDPKFPARSFTGNCVPANLVFGFTSNDDMCILPGAYYEANLNAPAGSECDLSQMPALKK